MLIIVFGYFLFIRNNQADRYAVIDKARLFSEFKMTKEIGNQMIILNNGLKMKYDSLANAYSSAQNEYDRIHLSQELEVLKTEIENLNDKFRDQETVKIWKRIQSYTDNYSEEKNYTFIFGFENNGNVVYFKKGKDITDELLNYINKRYEGIN